jgi:hypothetical protein
VDRLLRSVRERYRTTRRAILERGVTRGEVPAEADLELLLDVLTGAVVTRIRQGSGPLDSAWLARVIDFTLAAAGAAPAASTSSSSASRQPRLSRTHRARSDTVS